MYNLYLTSTFRHEWNRSFNPKIGKLLESLGFSCNLPQVYDSQKETEQEVFKRDIEGINNSEIILAIAENESPNWGGEIGYAYGIQKPIIALAQDQHNIPLILNGMITETLWVKNLDNIDEYADNLNTIIRRYLKIGLKTLH